jgi:hypothetical protein
MYSVDGEVNKGNPFTPAVGLPLNEQFLYRFSALEEMVRSGFRRIDEGMDRLQKDIHDRQIEVNDRINTLDRETAETFAFKRARIDKLTDRVAELETWSKVLTARLSIAFGTVIIVWTIVAPYIRGLIGIPNG